jgi:hypothetical protein
MRTSSGTRSRRCCSCKGSDYRRASAIDIPQSGNLSRCRRFSGGSVGPPSCATHAVSGHPHSIVNRSVGEPDILAPCLSRPASPSGRAASSAGISAARPRTRCTASSRSFGPARLRRAIAGGDAVVHLAARAHVFRESAADALAEFRAANVELTKRVAGRDRRRGTAIRSS